MKKSILKRLCVILIVFLLIMTESLPLANLIVFANDEHDSINITAYFSKKDEADTNSLICDVTEDSLKANFKVEVKNKGYLKNGTLTLGKDLNFSVKNEAENQIKNNQIKIKQIPENESEIISIPIKFKREDIISSWYMKHTNEFYFSGIYVDNEGTENIIEKTITLKLSWNEKTSTNISYELIKNLDYKFEDGSDGKIVQTKFSLNGEKQNNIPVKNYEMKIDVPQIQNMELQNFSVVSNKLLYSQGREDSEIDFSDKNYKLDGNKLIINIENNEKAGKLYNSCGEDEYIITYSYKGTKSNDVLKTNGNVNLSLNTYAGEQEIKDIVLDYDFSQSIGNIVQYSRDDKQSEISKGYLMANTLGDKYEITYEKRDVLNISRSDLIDSLEIIDQKEYFVLKGDKYFYDTEDEESVMSSYKTIEFSRENLINILGENGKVEILNLSDKVISTITFDLQTNENGVYIVEFSEPVSKVKIKISKPIADGNISVVSTKAIKQLKYSYNLVKDFYNLVSTSEAFVIYNEGVRDSLGVVESNLLINETSSNASLEVERTELSTTVTNEDVNFTIKLNNNEDTSDLYQNPVFEIKLPEAIKEVKVRNIDLFYANDELQIANVETLKQEEQYIIRVTLSGMQTIYNFNKETNGTIISFDLDLKLDEFTGNKDENIEMYYYNSASVKYGNEVDWSMMLGLDGVSYFKNGYYLVPCSFKGPEGLVSGQKTETKTEDEEKTPENEVTSVKQGAQSELIEEGVSAKLATMSIEIMNNTNKKYSNLQILGRIPFVGNKDIITGNDLGTTVDTILDTEVYSEDKDLGYTVYYSENGEATNDLNNEANAWKSDFYKLGAVKSYLIVLDSGYILEPNGNLEFNYDYMIPANLSAGDAFFGTYATYYQEESGNVSNSSADKIGYETKKNTTIEAEMNLVGDKLKELSDAEYEIILRNNTNVDAKNLDISFDIPNEFWVQNVEGENVSGTQNNRTININVGELKANSEEKVIARFRLSQFEQEENVVKLSANITGDNLAEEVKAETADVNVEKTNVIIEDNYYQNLKVAGDEYSNSFYISNVSDNEYKNVRITKKLGEAFEFTDSDISTYVSSKKEIEEALKDLKENKEIEYNSENIQATIGAVNEQTTRQINVVENYDSETKTITWEIDDFRSGDWVKIDYNTFIKIIPGKPLNNTDIINTETNLNDGKTIISTENKIDYKESQIKITNINNHEVGYGKEGDIITYIWEIENNNDYDVTDFECTPSVSENATMKDLRLESPLRTQDFFVSSYNTIFTVLPANSTSRIIVKAKINEGAENYITSKLEASYDLSYENTQEVYTMLENKSQEGYQLTGSAYIDSNKNQKQDEKEEVLKGILVELYNSETNSLVDSKVTDVSGRYTFNNLENGTYFVKFNYDNSEYVISYENANGISKDKSNVLNINDNCVTDNIKIQDKSISNVDIALKDDGIFDMKLDAYVGKMIVQNSAENNEFIYENNKLAKVDIDPKLVGESKVFIEYKVKVTNQGTVAGKINKLIDYMPKDMSFESELNPDWYQDQDGNVYTTSLENDVINPGESRELQLVLIKNMTEENTGLVHNSIEIADASNSKGIVDIDSMPKNGLVEDDLSSRDAIIGITTGLSISVLPIVIVSIIVIIPLGYLVYRIIEKRRYV